ncbi:MAG: hypothetical protein WBC63_03130 [Candidatus Bipolaricaulia bacterium]
MMAGLPKSRHIVVLALLLMASATFVALAEDMQTPSVVIDPFIEVQTPLEQIVELVDGNVTATAEQKEALVSAFEVVLDAGLLEPDAVVQLAAELLVLVNWESLTEPEALDLRVAAIASVLSEYLADPSIDPLAALATAYTEAVAPPGILNALEKSGVEADALFRVGELVESGLPPGIIIRVTKDALRDGATPAEILEILAALEAATQEDQSWGQAANEVTGQGEFKHQDKEENQNNGKNEDPEVESNQHGAQGNNGKA